MNKLKLTKLIVASSIIVSSFSLIGCTNNKTVNDTKEKVEQGANETKDKVKEGVNDITNTADETMEKFTDEEGKYDKNAIIKDLKSKGFNPEVTNTKAKDNQKIFSVDKQIVKIKGGELSLYEYPMDSKGKLEGDIKSIQDNGKMINGTTMTWNTAPHFYKKGRVLVVYDGDSQEIIKALNEILGNPLMG